jgi:hypothetical protein
MKPLFTYLHGLRTTHMGRSQTSMRPQCSAVCPLLAQRTHVLHKPAAAAAFASVSSGHV